MMDISRRVELVLRPFLIPTARFMVAVSGGPDSLALLHVLTKICPLEMLVVTHLNHGLRETADNEAQFVQETAVSWGLPCFIEKVDITTLALKEGLSLEEAGRIARYHFFARLGQQLEVTAVMVAHHADDQAETVLMHLLRGSGLAGLRGMLPVSSVPGSEKMLLIRPFLNISRQEIEAYCQQHHLSPVQDISNQDTSFFRNRIRHELLPLLEGYNPAIKTQLGHLANVLAADHELLEQQTAETWLAVLIAQGSNWVRLDKLRWQALSTGLQRRVLRRAVEVLRPSLQNVTFLPVEQARLVALNGETGSQSILPGYLTLEVSYEWLTITTPSATLPQTAPQLLRGAPEILTMPGILSLANGWFIEAYPQVDWEVDQLASAPDPWQVAITIPPDKTLQLRARLPGERFRPLGMRGQSAKVQDVMVNRKIPAHSRPLWPIIATETHLVWLVGHQLDERVRVTADSQFVVRLRCYRT